MSSRPALPSNLVDRVVTYFAPVRGMRRMQARTFLRMAGGYDGARGDRRAFQDWSPAARGADQDSVGDLEDLRARSRDALRNIPLAAGAQHTAVTAIVGWGLDPHPQVDREYLNLTADEANRWERQAKRLYWAWASSPTSCDFAGRCDLVGLTDLTFRSEFGSGDVFALRRYIEPRRGELLGLRIQLVEADRVSNPNWMPDSDQLIDGIELDEFGRPARYHVCNQHPGDFWSRSAAVWHTVPLYGPADGARQVLHLYRLLRPGQTRGIPDFAPILETLKQLGRYSQSELEAAVIQSFFTVFIKNTGGDPVGFSPLGADGQGTAPQPGTTTAASQVRMGPAMIAELGQNEEIQLANPARPYAGFETYFKAMVAQMGPALGMPSEVLLQQFQASYSASMASLQEAWRSFRTRRSHLVSGFNQPVYEWFLTECVIRGYLPAPGFFDDPLARAAWCGASWTGPSRGHLNPQQEASAMETRLKLGVTTLEQETAEYSGRDWEENHEQQTLEHEERAAAGLLAAAAPGRLAALPAGPPDDPAQDR